MNIKHLQGHQKPVFINDDEIQDALTEMEQNPKFDTKPTFSVGSEASPPRLVSFMEKHKTYLRDHPKINPEHYLSNLRTVLRIR